MQLIRTVSDMQAWAEEERQAGRRVALVPTLGALHEGHLALVRTAKAEAESVIVSIFVNPTQFGPDEDYDEYPRTLERDQEKLEALGGVEAVFAPSVEEMYPHGPENAKTWIGVEDLTEHLCGAHRPGHFRGVALIVAKLFLACRPHVAVFGEKDAQQLVILRRMARELHFGIEIEGVPIVREEDGLAVSSRNEYLSDEERAQAVVLSRAVAEARALVENGEQDAQAVVRTMHDELGEAPLAEVEYASVVDAETLAPTGRIRAGREVLAAVAVYFDDTRLIDSAFVRAPGGE
jgi:pantoate--beta-alanine ligase